MNLHDMYLKNLKPIIVYKTQKEIEEIIIEQVKNLLLEGVDISGSSFFVEGVDFTEGLSKGIRINLMKNHGINCIITKVSSKKSIFVTISRIVSPERALEIVPLIESDVRCSFDIYTDYIFG